MSGICQGHEVRHLIALPRRHAVMPLLVKFEKLDAAALPASLMAHTRGEETLCLAVAVNAGGGQNPTFANLFGLSQSKAHIAQALAAGETPRMIAAARGTNITTVRTQINSIRAKTGVSSTSHLIALYLQVR